MNPISTPHILIITGRDETGHTDTLLAGAYRKKFELNNIEVMTCSDDSPTDVLALLSEQKFDAIMFLCSESYLGDFEWTIEDRDWTILEERTKTKNAETPIFTLMFDRHLATEHRARELGVVFFSYKPNASLKSMLEAIEEQFVPKNCLVAC